MASKFFPFHRLGFRCNPFRSLTDEEWTAIALLPPTVLHALGRDKLHMQLLGPMGAGKSTTLLGLDRHFRDMGQHVQYEYLADGQQKFITDVQELDVFLLDEAQRLSRYERKRLMRAITHRTELQVVFSTHEDLTPLFARSGLLLTTVKLDNASFEQRMTMLNRRLQFFAFDEPLVSIEPSAVAWLVAQFGANQRACDAVLYEVFQQLDQPRSISAEDVQQEALRLTHGSA